MAIKPGRPAKKRLTEDELVSLRSERKDGASIRALSLKYGVTQYMAYYLCHPKDEARRWLDRQKYLFANYKISLNQFNNTLTQQGGKCAICGTEFKPEDDKHTDHDHEDDEFRGILCSNCNRGLGCFKDNVRYLLRAVDYLLESQRRKCKKAKKKYERMANQQGEPAVGA